MITSRYPRLVAPVTTAVLGSAIAIGAWIGAGWGPALVIEMGTIVGAVGYFVLGGGDTDLGALFGSRPDERQASLDMRATALAGKVLIVVAIGGVVVAIATGTAVWPFLLFCFVGAAAYLLGLVKYRNR